jgi:hypothetical protein
MNFKYIIENIVNAHTNLHRVRVVIELDQRPKLFDGIGLI